MNEEQKQNAKHTLVIFIAALIGGFLGSAIACHHCFKSMKRAYFYSKMAPMMRHFENFDDFEMPKRHLARPQKKAPTQIDREFFEENYILIPKEMLDLDSKDAKDSKDYKKTDDK